MAVAVGRTGKVEIKTSDPGPETVGEMGSWSISGPTRNTIEVSAFGDTVPRQEIGMLTGQTLTFSGYFDGTSTATRQIIDSLSSAAPILASTAQGFPSNLRLWAQSDSDLPGFGHWAVTTAGGNTPSVYITNMELGQSKDGVATISFTAAVVDDDMKWTTTT